MTRNGTSNGENTPDQGRFAQTHQLLSLEKLGAAISARRGELKLSQEELANRSDVHRSYISEIERGQRNFTIKILARIAECLNVSMAKLLQEATLTEETDAGAKGSE
jgi:transcriptional regulator with XRE-family HTH domain